MSDNSENGIFDAVSTDETIIHNLRHCASVLRGAIEGRGSQRRVLIFLMERGPMNQREILEEMGVKAGSLSELLSKLESRGYILKQKSPLDKRNYCVSITGEGIRALGEMQTQHNASVRDLLSGLDDDEKTQLAGLLTKLRGQWAGRLAEQPNYGGLGHRHGGHGPMRDHTGGKK